MLQQLRKQAQSPVIQFIVILIAIVFIFWGAGTKFFENRQTAITVNNEEISFQEFQQAYNRTYENIAAQFGGNLPKGFAETLNIKEQVANQLIQTALLRQGAKQLGILVSHGEIQKAITDMPQFQEKGAFSIDRYNKLLAANHLTPSKFEKSMQQDMLSTKVIQEIGKFALFSSDFEVNDLFQQNNEKVAVSFVQLSPESFKNQISVKEEELAAWFDKNKDSFKSEAETKVKYLAFTYADISRKIEIEEAKISAYYDQHTADYTIPEKRKGKMIFLSISENTPAETRAQKKSVLEGLRERIQKGEDFASLAQKYSEDESKNKGGEIPPQKAVPSAEPGKTLHSLNQGEISAVVEGEDGLYLVKLEAKTAAEKRPLAAVRNEIKATMQRKEAESIAFQLANSAYEGIIAAGSIPAYLEKHPEEKLIATDFFTKKKPPVEFAGDQELISAAFALNKGELSSLKKTASGYYILLSEDKKEPVIPALDSVRKEATAQYIDSAMKDKAKTEAEALLKQLKEGAKLADLAHKAGLQVKESGFISKNVQKDSAFPAELTNQAFALSTLAPLPDQPGLVGATYYVYTFLERKAADLTGKDEELQQYRQNLQRYKQQQLLSEFLDQQRKQAKITRSKSL